MLTELFQIWLQSSWPIAWVMSFAANVAVYCAGAWLLTHISHILISRYRVAHWIDGQPVPAQQQRAEVYFGVTACTMFATTSLLTRQWFAAIWPASLLELLSQLLMFTVYYELYSYFVHRLLHLPLLRKIHGVHHRSTTVTPWSAYSVHPIEALLIGLSAPLFMSWWPMSLSLVLAFHMLGMLFTMMLHSNLALNGRGMLVQMVNGYCHSHALHHQRGNVNFGFLNRYLDKIFGTGAA